MKTLVPSLMILVVASAARAQAPEADWKQVLSEATAALSAPALAPQALLPIPVMSNSSLSSPSAGAAAAATIAAPAASPSLSLSAAPPPPLFGAPTEEKLKLDKISTLNQIDQQELLGRLRPLNEEREESVARYNLQFEKNKLELAALEAELKKLQLESAVADERRKTELAALRADVERRRAENERERVRLEAEQLKSEQDGLKIANELRELDLKSRKLDLETELAKNRTVALKAELELRDKKDEWRKEANREPDYLKEPFKDGALVISDRRVGLNGPIVYGVADHITERIDYFNNKSSELPIFIVIDRSPGGSVMEGYRIVKAIQSSRAPVHVVVKSFAASMAATIASLAPRSYAYPNAIILHHQIFSWIVGNPTQQKQQLAVVDEWNRRLLSPVATKMGLSLEELTQRMYQNSVDGDWEAFADEAVALKWIDHVAHEIRETGVLKEPKNESTGRPALPFGLSEGAEPSGERFVRLPRLQPYDAYFLHNKDAYYR